MTGLADVPVFSVPVALAGIPAAGHRLEILADAARRRRLAEAYGVTEVRSFSADLLVERQGADGARVSGRLEAEIEQPCVVTLEPVLQTIAEDVDIVFVRDPGDVGAHDLDDPEAPDPPEVIEGDEIDPGALVEQLFVLAIDPYPRSEGVEVPPEYGPNADDGSDSPFSALAVLKTGEEADSGEKAAVDGDSDAGTED